MRVIYTLVVFSFIFCSTAIAQIESLKVKKYDKFFKKKAYGQYVKMLGNEDFMDLSRETLIQLAKSYHKIGDTKNAEKYYAMVLEDKTDEKIQFLYAQTLHANAKYPEAYKAYKQAAKAAKEGDLRAENLAKACLKVSQFRAIGNIQIRNEKALNGNRLDFSPSFYEDGVVFVSTRGPQYPEKQDKWLNDNFMDLYYAKTNENGSWETPKLFSLELNSKYHEGPITFTEDGTKAFFTRNNYLRGRRGKSKDNITKLKIYSSRKLNGRWTDIREMRFNSNEIDVCHPAVSPDGKTLIFSANRKDSYGGMDLYVSYLVGNHWTAPENLGSEINTAGNELFPFIHADGSLFYASNGLEGLGGLDIFIATALHQDKHAKWAMPLNLGAPFNSHYDDFGLILDRKGDYGYFSTNREGGKGKDDIYHFELENGFEEVRPAPLEAVNICVYDNATNDRIEGAKVLVRSATAQEFKNGVDTKNQLKDNWEAGTLILSLTPVRSGADEYLVHINAMNSAQQSIADYHTTNADGVFDYFIRLSKPYVLEIEKDGYLFKKELFTIPMGQAIEEYCVGLEQRNLANNDINGTFAGSTNAQDPNNSASAVGADKTPMNGVVFNKEYNRPLPKAAVELLNRCTGEFTKVNVNKDGAFSNVLECGCDYVLRAKSDNFIGASRIINLSDSSNCKQPVKVDLPLVPGFDKLGNPIKVGGNTLVETIKEGDLIELRNIYYDYDKYYIREDASQDLKDIIQLMTIFPSMEIELSSHTDSRGTVQYNNTLSLNRAKSAKQYIVKNGNINPNRIKAVGYGENRLRNQCSDGTSCSEYEHQRNRRTEVFITKFNQADYVKIYYKNNEPTKVDAKPGNR